LCSVRDASFRLCPTLSSVDKHRATFSDIAGRRANRCRCVADGLCPAASYPVTFSREVAFSQPSWQSLRFLSPYMPEFCYFLEPARPSWLSACPSRRCQLFRVVPLVAHTNRVLWPSVSKPPLSHWLSMCRYRPPGVCSAIRRVRREPCRPSTVFVLVDVVVYRRSPVNLHRPTTVVPGQR